MRRIFFFLFALAVLGILGGYQLLNQGDEEQPQGVSTTAFNPGTPTDGMPAADVVLATPDSVATDGDRAVLSQGELPVLTSESSGASQLRAVRGRVVDAYGRAVAGAEVRLVEARSGIMRIGFGRSRSAKPQITGDDGMFEIDAGTKESLSLSVEAARYAPLSRAVVPSGPLTEIGDVVLDRGVVLSGIVVDELGNGLAGIQVRRGQANQGSGLRIFTSDLTTLELLAETDAGGRFTVDRQAVGPWALVFTSDEHPKEEFAGTTSVADEEVNDIMITMADGFEIAGRVAGAPAADELVVRANPAGGGGGILRLEGFGNSGRQAKVLSDGSFVIAGLRRGKEYELTLYSDQAQASFLSGALSSVVKAEAGDRDVTLEWQAGTTLVFQVVDALSNDPIEELRIEAGAGLRGLIRGSGGQSMQRYPGGIVRHEGMRPRMGQNKGSLEIHAAGFEDFSKSGLDFSKGGELDLGILRLQPVPVVIVKVTDRQNGRPIEGATVILEEYKDEESAGAPGRRRFSFSMSTGDAAPQVSALPGEGARSGKTDSEGIVRLNSIPGAQARLRVKARDYAPHVSDPMSLPAIGDVDHAIQMGLGGLVEVLVVDGDGRPVADARVDHRTPSSAGSRMSSMTMGMGPKSQVKADAQGRALFRNLEVGEHSFKLDDSVASTGQTMSFAIRGMDLGGDDWSKVVVSEGQTATVTLVVPAKGVLRGQVTEAGQPLAGANLTLVEDKGDDNPLGALASLLGRNPSTVTDSEGRFEFLDVTTGNYKLEVKHNNRAMAFEEQLEILEGRNKHDLDLPTTIVEGRVVDAQGKPLAGVKVEAKKSGASSGPRVMLAFASTTDGGATSVTTLGGEEIDTQTDEQGYYVLRGLLTDVELTVTAEVDGMQPATSKAFELEPGETRSGLDLVIMQGGAVDVQVVDADGNPASQAMVRASYKGEAEGVEPRMQSVDKDGYVRLKGLEAGIWEFRLLSLGSGAQSPDPQQIEVVEGQTASLRLDQP